MSYPSSTSMKYSLKQPQVGQLPPLQVVWPEPGIAHASDQLHPSNVLATKDTRQSYLLAVKAGNNTTIPPPVISVSEFVPRVLVEHLMRRKRGMAIAQKFVAQSGITNMEGAMHTFVTPMVLRCEMDGDYVFSGGHGVTPPRSVSVGQGDAKKLVKLTRSVVLSASIHFDFEKPTVMLELCKLRIQEVVGQDLNTVAGWKVLSKADKQINVSRESYDEGLRRHMVYHLTSSKRFPAISEVNNAMTVPTAISFLEAVIAGQGSVPEQIARQFAKIATEEIVSLELLFNSAVHVARNELSALEALCPQGYVYTYDPAKIFAGIIGSTMLNRLFLAAIKHLSNYNKLANLRIFAFNDFADDKAVGLSKAALSKQTAVTVLPKSDLFRGDGGRYNVDNWSEAQGAMLVIHNNSDAFGQNIETEGTGGSLDGAIGAASSAAASLERNRPDLMDYIF